MKTIIVLDINIGIVEQISFNGYKFPNDSEALEMNSTITASYPKNLFKKAVEDKLSRGIYFGIFAVFLYQH